MNDTRIFLQNVIHQVNQFQLSIKLLLFILVVLLKDTLLVEYILSAWLKTMHGNSLDSILQRYRVPITTPNKRLTSPLSIPLLHARRPQRTRTHPKRPPTIHPAFLRKQANTGFIMSLAPRSRRLGKQLRPRFLGLDRVVYFISVLGGRRLRSRACELRWCCFGLVDIKRVSGRVWFWIG